MAISLGVHVGQQNMPMSEMRALWRKLDAAGVDWISAWGPLLRGASTGRHAAPLRGARHAGRPRGRDRTRPHRLPRVLCRLSQPRPARQGGDHARPHFGRAFRTRHRRGLAHLGGVRLWLRLPGHRHAPGHARRGGRRHPAAPHRGSDDLLGPTLPGGRRILPATTRAGPPAHLDRGPGRTAYAGDRRPPGGRMERGVRLRGRVAAPERRAGPLVRGGRPRPRRDSPRGEPGLRHGDGRRRATHRTRAPGSGVGRRRRAHPGGGRCCVRPARRRTA